MKENKFIFNNTIVVIRSSNERTVPACEYFVKKYLTGAQVEIINEIPFTSCLKKCYQLGKESGKKFMITVDGDVLILPSIINVFGKKINSKDNFIEYRAKGICGLMLRTKNIGPRLYNLKYIDYFLKELHTINPIIKRPEATIVLNIKNKFKVNKNISNETICLHDFGQWHKDIYRKGSFFKIKHSSYKINNALAKIKKLKNDIHYKPFIEGINDSKKYKLDNFLNARKYPTYSGPEREPMLQEEWESSVKYWLDHKADIGES